MLVVVLLLHHVVRFFCGVFDTCVFMLYEPVLVPTLPASSVTVTLKA